jgi:hypothetical protein
VSADRRLSQPTVRVVACCARAASGADKQLAAALIAVMKSRRLISCLNMIFSENRFPLFGIMLMTTASF